MYNFKTKLKNQNLQAAESFLNDFKLFLIQQQLSKNSIKNYLADLRDFFRWLNRVKHQLNVNQFTSNSFQAYRNHLQQKQAPHSTIRRRMATLRQFGLFLKSQNLISQNPAKTVKNPVPQIGIRSQLKKFKAYLKDQGLAKATIKNYMADVGQFAHWGQTEF